MSLSFTIFLYCIFLVSLSATYTVLYLIAYKALKLDKLMNDNHLAIILLVIAIFLSPLLFSPIFDVACYLILSWNTN